MGFTQDILKSVLALIGAFIVFIIIIGLFVLIAGTQFIKFLLSIPLTYLWSIGILFLLFYAIKRGVLNGHK